MSNTTDVTPDFRCKAHNHGRFLSLSEFRQEEDYDCGVYATAFFIFLCGRHVDFCEISAVLDPRPDVGTLHKNILNYFGRLLHMQYEVVYKWDELEAPALVNFQYEEDGHFGVVTHITEDDISIFEPYRANVINFSKEDFISCWYSRQTGAPWGLVAL